MRRLNPSIILPLLLTLGSAGFGSAYASSLLLDFGQTTAASPYLTLSPAHSTGAVPGSDTSWNTIASSAATSSLLFGDSSAATGVTLTLGQEATVGNGIISFSTAIANTALVGNGGGVAGQQSFLGAGSIYGDDSSSTATGRDGFFGGGTAAAGAAIGLRLDGLAAGDYFLFVMARNVNSNVGSQPMNIFATAGLSDVTFDFSSLTANPQSNVGYASAGYAGEYNTFVNGENYVGITVSVGTGESLFLAVDAAGTGTTLETRGFINSVAVAPVPEPSALALLLIGGLGLIFVRRTRSNLE
jgi:hypothetical protein